jgi:anti-sigma factor RsiW
MWNPPFRPDECARACEWASLRLDSQLSDFEEILLEAHLTRCPACTAFAETATRVTEILRTAPLEQLAFPIQLPRRRGARVYSLRAVSTVAAAAMIGLSGVLGLELSRSRVPSAAASPNLALIGLKEQQMDELDSAGSKASPKVRPNLAAAEQVTVGNSGLASTRPRSESRRSFRSMDRQRGR